MEPERIVLDGFIEKQMFLGRIVNTLAAHPEWFPEMIQAATDGISKHAEESVNMRASAVAVAQLLIKTKEDAEYVNKFCNREMWARDIVDWIDKMMKEGK